MSDLDEYEQAYQRWRARSLEPLERQSAPRQRAGLLAGGEDTQTVYTPLDVRGIDMVRDVGFPGQAPFVRGVQANMFRGRLWTMRQYAGFGTAKASNARYRMLLEKGQTGLSVAFDLPTQMGRDSDHPMSLGEAGKVGVANDSTYDMEVLPDGIPLQQVDTSQDRKPTRGARSLSLNQIAAYNQQKR